MRKTKLFILSLCGAIVLMSCSEDLQKKTESKMQEMAALSELGTVEYTVTKVVKGRSYSHVRQN